MYWLDWKGQQELGFYQDLQPALYWPWTNWYAQMLTQTELSILTKMLIAPGSRLEMTVSPSACVPQAWQICSCRLRVMSQGFFYIANKATCNGRFLLLIPTAEGLVQAMNSGNDHYSHPYNTTVLLNARKWNLYSQKLDFDSSAVDRLMQSLLWCAWMTDGLFSFLRYLFTRMIKDALFP